MNYLIILCGLLQLGGSIIFISQGQYRFGALYFLYGLTNFLLCYGEKL